MAYTFVRSVINADDYRELQERNGHWVARIKEEENADGTITVAECATQAEPQMEVVRAAYNTWLNKQQERKLLASKAEKIVEIDTFDKSPEVNAFVVNGVTAWLDKSDRVGLMNSIQIEQNCGKATTMLWLGGQSFEMGCTKAIQLLSAVELYAMECYNVTATHKAEVASLTAIDDVEAYDVTAGYPQKVSVTVGDDMTVETDKSIAEAVAAITDDSTTVLTLQERMTNLEARVGALEADAAAASGETGAAMMIDDEL